MSYLTSKLFTTNNKSTLNQCKSNHINIRTKHIPTCNTANVPILIVIEHCLHQSPTSTQENMSLISKDILSINQLRDGKLLLLMKDNLTENKFLLSKELFRTCSIVCKPNDLLNCSKGTIYAPFLSKIPAQEITEKLNF